MHKLMTAGIGVVLMAGAAYGGLICSGESAAIRVNMPLPTVVSNSLILYASPWDGAGESVSVAVDGTCLFSTTNQSETAWRWQPLALGPHTLTCTFGTNVLTTTLNVTALDFFVQPAPNPPMAQDNNISITPTTRNFGVNGGGNAIIVSGSSDTWTAAANDTGKTRTGKIIVAGEVYTLEQRARQMVAITATAEHGGHVSGGGSYDLGTQVTLTAVPDSGYAFSYWTGAVSSMQNPLTVTVDVAKSYTAVFEPLPIALTNVVSDTNGVLLAWNNLAWAGTYRIYRGVTSVPSSATVLVELSNNGNCMYLDETGDVDVEYWYWIEAEGPSDEVMSDPMTGRKEKPIIISPITYDNLRGATNPNPETYREGTLVSFQNPGAVTGYTFAGWTPAQITADMTGAQTVRAAWTANSYSIAYNPNGGSGTMEATAATYDSEATVAANGFTWAGHVFAGWATNDVGEVVYAAGAAVSNLTAQSSGVVTLYAVWEPLVVAAPVVTPADSRLANHIKTAADYNAYRAWGNAKGLDHQAVKDSPRAWFSYAVGW